MRRPAAKATRGGCQVWLRESFWWNKCLDRSRVRMRWNKQIHYSLGGWGACVVLTVVCGRAVLRRAFQFGYVNAIIQAVKRSRGAGWDDIRTTMDPLKPEVPKL